MGRNAADFLGAIDQVVASSPTLQSDEQGDGSQGDLDTSSDPSHSNTGDTSGS